MENDELPLELKRLERELASRPRAEPPPGLRERVIGGVSVRLRRKRPERLSYAAAVAAAVALLVNLSMSATQATDYRLRAGDPSPPVHTAAERIRRLLPEISPDEALRQARLMRAGSSLPQRPDVPSHPLGRDGYGRLEDLLIEGD